MKKEKIKAIALSKSKGFTLIEVVVVMAIIAVLAVLVVGAITVARRTAMETANRSNARSIQSCLEAYYSANKKYCGTTNVTCAVATNAKSLAANMTTDGIPCKIATGSSDDTTTGGVDIPATTGLVATPPSYLLKVKNYGNSGYIDSDITN